MTVCPICNSFFTQPTRLRGSPQIYCSQKCRARQKHNLRLIVEKARTAARLAEVAPVPCAGCELISFKPKSDRHKFCSLKCRRKVENQRGYRKNYRRRRKLRRIAARQVATPQLVLTSD